MSRIAVPSLALLALLAVASPLRADAPSAAAALTEAEALVGRGDFGGAARAYRTALDAGADNAGVLYGLGTAALKSSDIGTAVWALERAVRLAPGDGDVVFNLERGLERVAGDLGAAARLSRPAERLVLLTQRGWQGLALGLALLGLLLATAVALRPHWRWLRRTAGSALVVIWALAAAAAAGWYGRWHVAERGDSVVVASAAVSAREAPAARAPVAFVLEPGHRIRAIERRADHLRVRLNNGLEGWVERGAVALVEGEALVATSDAAP